MITAEPDCIIEKLQPVDEFIIVACDGVWDVMSNQAAVDFVRSRLSKTPLPTIVEQLLDFCLADDPRETAGIGGDNMTCIIAQLPPTYRS